MASNKITVVAIDPGLHTGVAMFTDEGRLQVSAVVETPRHRFQNLVALLEHYRPTTVVAEEFTMGNPYGNQVHADVCKVIGCACGWATMRQRDFATQQASTRTAFLDNAKMFGNHLGLLGVHFTDALAHGLAWHYSRGTRVIGCTDPVHTMLWTTAKPVIDKQIPKAQWNEEALWL